MRTQFIVASSLILLIGSVVAFFYQPAVWSYIAVILLGYYDIIQNKHTLWRNYPVIGYTR